MLGTFSFISFYGHFQGIPGGTFQNYWRIQGQRIEIQLFLEKELGEVRLRMWRWINVYANIYKQNTFVLFLIIFKLWFNGRWGMTKMLIKKKSIWELETLRENILIANYISHTFLFSNLTFFSGDCQIDPSNIT